MEAGLLVCPPASSRECSVNVADPISIIAQDSHLHIVPDEQHTLVVLVDATVRLAPALYLVIFVWHVYWATGIAEASPFLRDNKVSIV